MRLSKTVKRSLPRIQGAGTSCTGLGVNVYFLLLAAILNILLDTTNKNVTL